MLLNNTRSLLAWGWPHASYGLSHVTVYFSVLILFVVIVFSNKFITLNKALFYAYKWQKIKKYTGNSKATVWGSFSSTVHVKMLLAICQTEVLGRTKTTWQLVYKLPWNVV